MKQQPIELTINGENKLDELLEFGKVIGIDRVAPERYSLLLLLQLYTETITARRMNPAKVIHEIRALEGLDEISQTKPPVEFKYPPLKGLWHKHYMVDGISSMARNLRLSLLKHGMPWLDDQIKKGQETGEEKYLTEEDVGMIVNDAVHGNWMRRASASELTGEWIVYARHENANYYLCLAQHSSEDNHISLRKQIDTLCCKEFPFLTSMLI